MGDMNEMYNAEQKQRFLEMAARRNSKGTMSSYAANFRQSAPFEKELQKDLSTFTYYEIEAMYKRRNSTSLSTLQTLNSRYKKYTDWCILQTLVPDCQNHFREMSVHELELCINSIGEQEKIVSREQVLTWAAHLSNPREQFVLLGAFEGIITSVEEDLKALALEHIQDNIVTMPGSGRKVIISDQLFHYAVESANEFRFYMRNGCVAKFDESDRRIIKQRNSSDYEDFNKLLQRIVRQNIQPIIGSEMIKITTLKDAGTVHWIKEKSKEKNITGLEYLNQYADEIRIQFGHYQTTVYRLREMFGRYLE